jgi:hypothetical protein
MLLNLRCRWDHNSPFGVIAIEQPKHPGSLFRIALGHVDLLAADQLVEGAALR